MAHSQPGLDVSYDVTPSLRLSRTVNTDLGESEVDDGQINLTGFSIFFPEKRSFFLRDAGMLSFATTGIGQHGGLDIPVPQPLGGPAEWAC